MNHATAETKLKSSNNCKAESVIYEASVSTSNETKTYIGLTANQIKRISAHKTTLNCKPDNRNYNKYVNSTKLSKLCIN